MALITREINNYGAPIYGPDGSLYANKEITFQLVNAKDVPCDAWDVASNSRVLPIKETIITNSQGEFSVTLWPNDRGNKVTYYSCVILGFRNSTFRATLPSGDTPIEWVDFMSNSQPLSVIELSAFQTHINNTSIHGGGGGVVLTPSERAAWMGIWFGTQAEYDALDSGLKKTYAQWLSSGSGYFEFHILPDEAGIYLLTGIAAALVLSANIPTITRTWSVSGVPANLLLSGNTPLVVMTPAGSVSLAGVVADMPLSGNTPALNVMRTVVATALDLALAGNAPAVVYVPNGTVTTSLDGITAVCAFLGNAPSLVIVRALAGVIADMNFSGNAGVITRMWSITGVTAGMSVASNAPTVKRTWAISAVTANTSLSGNSPTVGVSRSIAGVIALLPLSANLPSVKRTWSLAGVTASLPLTGNAGTVAFVAGASAPAQVTGLTVVNTTPQLKADWNNLSDEISFELFYATAAASNNGADLYADGYGSGHTAYPGSPNATAGKITGIAANTLTYTLNGMLAEGVTYYIKIAGRNSAGLGTLSDAAAAAAAAAAIVFNWSGPTITINGSVRSSPYTLPSGHNKLIVTAKGGGGGNGEVSGSSGGGILATISLIGFETFFTTIAVGSSGSNRTIQGGTGGGATYIRNSDYSIGISAGGGGGGGGEDDDGLSGGTFVITGGIMDGTGNGVAGSSGAYNGGSGGVGYYKNVTAVSNVSGSAANTSGSLTIITE